MTSEKIKKLKSSELISLYKDLNDSIYVIECYGTNDVVLLSLVCEELERRELLSDLIIN